MKYPILIRKTRSKNRTKKVYCVICMEKWGSALAEKEFAIERR